MFLVMRVWIGNESEGAKISGGSKCKSFVKGPFNLEVIARFHPNLGRKTFKMSCLFQFLRMETWTLQVVEEHCTQNGVVEFKTRLICDKRTICYLKGKLNYWGKLVSTSNTASVLKCGQAMTYFFSSLLCCIQPLVETVVVSASLQIFRKNPPSCYLGQTVVVSLFSPFHLLFLQFHCCLVLTFPL